MAEVEEEGLACWSMVRLQFRQLVSSGDDLQFRQLVSSGDDLDLLLLVERVRMIRFDSYGGAVAAGSGGGTCAVGGRVGRSPYNTTQRRTEQPTSVFGSLDEALISQCPFQSQQIHSNSHSIY